MFVILWRFIFFYSLKLTEVEVTRNLENTILVIDDDPLLHRIVEACLMKENYRLVFAQSGEAGLQLAKKVLPDLILLDVVMPNMDGFEVCSHLRSDEELKYIPIIILTALDDRDSKIQGLEAGADDYICKPFDKIEFRARINTIVKLNRFSQLRQIGKLEAEILDLLNKLQAKEAEIEKLKRAVHPESN